MQLLHYGPWRQLLQVRKQTHFSVVDASGRLLTSLLALATFDDVTSLTVKILIGVNLFVGVFVPIPIPVTAAEEPDELTEPLVEDAWVVQATCGD